ncbi:hypothetical protein ES703_45334 [subsurface metagenome]
MSLTDPILQLFPLQVLTHLSWHQQFFPNDDDVFRAQWFAYE